MGSTARDRSGEARLLVDADQLDRGVSSNALDGTLNCVEVGDAAHLIAVRDSKDPDGACLAFGREAWEAFAARLKVDTN